MEWWQNFSRECMGPGHVKIDASVVCHEIRCPDLRKEEKSWFSIRDARTVEREQFGACGEAVHMTSLHLESTILLQSWACAGQPLHDASRRVCGEVRIPVRHLINKCNSCLYHTWLLLDSPGLNDSIASMSMPSGKGEAFDQALLNGPKQLHEHGICLSVMKTSELPGSGRMIWTDDLAHEARVAYWSSLLRSQQQHVVMCKVQSLSTQRSVNDSALLPSEELTSLQDQLRDTTATLEAERRNFEQERLREQTVEAEMKRLQAKVFELENLSNRPSETPRFQPPDRRSEDEVEKLREELDAVQKEANQKIQQANERLRAMRKEKDDANDKLKRLETEDPVMEELKSENKKLLDSMMQSTARVENLENLLHSKTLDMSKQCDQMKSMENSIKIAQVRENELQEKEKAHQAKIVALQGIQNEKNMMQATFDGQQMEVARMQVSHDATKKDNEGLRAKLDEISTEANKKIDAANERIKSVKRELEDCRQENEHLKSQHAAHNGQASQALRNQVQMLEERDLQRVAEIQRLREQVAQLEIKCQVSSHAESMSEEQTKELITLRATNQNQKEELASLKKAFDSVCIDGKEQLGSLAEQVRFILRDREAFREDSQRLGQENLGLKQNITGLEEEISAISEQKDALMKIIEDLNESCVVSGLPELVETGRLSMASVRNFRAITPKAGTPRLTPRNSFSPF